MSMDPYEMDADQLAIELGVDVPEDGVHSLEQKPEDNKKRKEGRKGAWRATLVATASSIEEEEEHYAEFQQKENTSAIASINESNTATTIVSYDREGKEITVVIDHCFGEKASRLAKMTESQKKRSAALSIEQEAIAKSAEELITEVDSINALAAIDADNVSLRRRSILVEMYAFQLGLQARRWATKRAALEEDIAHPKPQKEREDGKGRKAPGGPKLGKYEVLQGHGGPRGKGRKDGKTDRFGKFDTGRVAKNPRKERKPKRERAPRKEREPRREREPRKERPAPFGDAMIE